MPDQGFDLVKHGSAITSRRASISPRTSLICFVLPQLTKVDTLRTLQQTSTNFNYVLPIRRYWQGLGASLALTTPAFTVYMVSYRQCKQELTPYLGDTALSNYFISSSVAELASSGLWTPMEVIKGRMQIHEGPKATTFDLIRDIYHTQGVKGFFRGYWMVCYSAFFFPVLLHRRRWCVHGTNHRASWCFSPTRSCGGLRTSMLNSV